MADGDSPRELLVRAGLRPTRRRLAVLAALGEAPAPLTAAQARERAAPRAAMDRVTAYRILEASAPPGWPAVLAGGRAPAATCSSRVRAATTIPISSAASAGGLLPGRRPRHP